ncbi:MAG: hypothetical protein WCG84_01200 [Candidatus Moraniibacteriota bacterium]
MLWRAMRHELDYFPPIRESLIKETLFGVGEKCDHLRWPFGVAHNANTCHWHDFYRFVII